MAATILLAAGRRARALAASSSGRRAAVVSEPVLGRGPGRWEASALVDAEQEESLTPEERRRRVLRAIEEETLVGSDSPGAEGHFSTLDEEPHPPSTQGQGDAGEDSSDGLLLEIFEMSLFGARAEASIRLHARLGRHHLKLSFDDSGEVLMVQGDEAGDQEQDWLYVWRRVCELVEQGIGLASQAPTWLEVGAMGSSESCLRQGRLAVLAFDGLHEGGGDRAWSLRVLDVSGAPRFRDDGRQELHCLRHLRFRWPQDALPIRVTIRLCPEAKVLHAEGVLEVDHMRNIHRFFFLAWDLNLSGQHAEGVEDVEFLPEPRGERRLLLSEWATCSMWVHYVEFPGLSRAPAMSPDCSICALLFESGDEDDEAEVLMLVDLDHRSGSFGEVLAQQLMQSSQCRTCGLSLPINAQELVFAADCTTIAVCGGRQAHKAGSTTEAPCSAWWHDFVAVYQQVDAQHAEDETSIPSPPVSCRRGAWLERPIFDLCDTTLSLWSDRDSIWVPGVRGQLLTRTSSRAIPSTACCMPSVAPQARLLALLTPLVKSNAVGEEGEGGCQELARAVAPPHSLGQPPAAPMQLTMSGACPALYLPGFGPGGLGVSVRLLHRPPWTIERLLWLGHRAGAGGLGQLSEEGLRRILRFLGRGLDEALSA